MANNQTEGKIKDNRKASLAGILSQFSAGQLHDFREAFNMIDQNRDGFIDFEDLEDVFSSLGGVPSDRELTKMLDESPGAINFTSFLTFMGQKTAGSDPQDAMIEAFEMFDPDNTGYISEEFFRDLLMNMGDIFTADEIRRTWEEIPLDNGRVNYNKFVQIMKGSH